MGSVMQDMSAQHIALVFHDFSTGGSERIAIRLGNAWARAGRKVTIYCGTEEGSARSLVGPGVDVVACVPPIRRGLTSRIKLGWKLGPILKSVSPQILFAPGNFHLPVLAILGRRMGLNRPPIICKLSNPLLPGGLPVWLSACLAKPLQSILSVVDQWTAMSSLLASDAARIIGDRPLVTIPEPVLDSSRRLPQRSFGPDRIRYILAVGRLEAQKDFGLALRAFAELSPLTRSRLIILGEGPDRKKLIRMARQLGIADRVEFPGYVSNVQEWLERADLFLMTSHFEGFPAVLVEARAAGLPIVSTDCSVALPEIISSVCHGEIVSGREPALIGNAIGRWLDAKGDDRQSRCTGTEAFVMGNVAPLWLKLFDGIAS